MSTTLQNINSIAPMSGASDEGPKDQARTDYEQGKRLFEKGDLAQAAVSLHNALLGYEEKGDKGGVANASNQLGHVCFAKEDFTSAEKHYLRAQELCRELGDQLSLFSLLKRFVEVYRGLKDYEKAVKLSFDILDTYYANNDPRGTVSALENLADIYLDAGQPDKAADSLRTIASIHRNFGHKSIADSFERKASELEPGA